MKVESIYGRRSRIASMVDAGIVGPAVIEELFEGGTAISDEAVLWDFKKELPLNPSGPKETDRDDLTAKFHEIVKDCVAFYNSYGGYLIIGVDDSTREPLGFSAQFDASDLNKRISGATGVSIETHYRRLTLANAPATDIGLLFIPKRPVGKAPAQLKKDAPPSSTGKRAYKAKDFYLRVRDTCTVASTPDDYEFLYGERQIVDGAKFVVRLDNTLPPRDPDLGELRGREREMTALWRWLSDQFSPVKVLCGLGGLGKTSIAYTFGERLVFHSAPDVDRLVWLGAKETTFSALRDQDVSVPRLDFNNIDGMLRELLLETGCPPEQIPDQPSREQLLELASQHLSAFRYLLILDNIDTLVDDEQQQVFHLVTQLCAISGAKALLTARRNLGAPQSAYTEIEGLPRDDLAALAKEKCSLLKIREPDASDLAELHRASGGSPLFALSVLRLVALGDTFKSAVGHWRGSDGEAVRDAAFKREIARLTPNEGRVMLVLSYLDAASIVELTSVLKLTRHEVQTAIEGLKALAMTTFASELPGGAAFRLPIALSLVTPLLEKRIPDWADIRRQCYELKRIFKNKESYVAQAVTRAVAALKYSTAAEAVSISQEAVLKLPDNADLKCLLGRCLVEDGKLENAEEAFEAAAALGCDRKELFDHWIELRVRRQDWRGVVPLSEQAEKKFSSSRYVALRNQARCQVGDELARTGNYVDATATYQLCLTEIHNGLREYTYGPDRAALWRLNETVVIRWLGAVKMEGERLADGNRRFFGACWKAVISYKHLSKQTLQSGLTALAEWVSNVELRKVVSDTAKEHLQVAGQRLLQLVHLVAEKPDQFADFAEPFGDQATALNGRIRRLVGS